MDIHKVAKDHFMNISSAKQTLKTGQIIQGKILKIYPNNKAQIRLGSQVMIAQLEFPLAVGEQYHFQVESSEDLVHLKVIGEDLKGKTHRDIADLLEKLDLKFNRTNTDFVKKLINQKIPFQRSDLSKAFALLENTNLKEKAQQVLKEMFIRKLPITDSVFQALLSKNTTTLSDQVKHMIAQLRTHNNPTDLQQKLLDRLVRLSELPLTGKNYIISQMIRESGENNREIFEVLKMAGLIDDKMDFLTWKTKLQMLISQHNIKLPDRLNQQSGTLDISSSLRDLTFSEALKQLKNLQLTLSTGSEASIKNWKNIISEISIAHTQFSKQENIYTHQNVTDLMQELTEKIVPLLTKSHQFSTNIQLPITEGDGYILQQLKQAQLEVQVVSQKVINQWVNLVAKTVVSNDMLSHTLKQDIIVKLMPLLNMNESFASNEQLSQLQSKFPVPIEAIEKFMQNMQRVGKTLQSASQLFVGKWANTINESTITNIPLSDEFFDDIKQDITTKILPLLTEEQQQNVEKQLHNRPEQLQQLLKILQTYANEKNYMKIDQMLTKIAGQDLFNVMDPQGKFLSQLREVFSLSGLTHDNLLHQDASAQQVQTIKSMLIQMIQQGGSADSERAQQVLHFINGLQLQSVNEVGSFIQASMQIPGNKLSLNNDLYIEFESKKTDDGKVNPNFCRILFYLDLSALKETVIDMQVQKKLVSVTVFNDHKLIKEKSSILQPALKEGLESIDYQLSNVVVKPLQELNNEKKESVKNTFHNTYEGIEFRV